MTEKSWIVTKRLLRYSSVIAYYKLELLGSDLVCTKINKEDVSPYLTIPYMDMYGRIIARGYNKRETKKNALLHAEITAIDKAAKKLGGWRLTGCEMYVTLEPCPMCAGAIIQSRIERLFFGAYDKKAGCAGSVVNLFESGLFNHDVCVRGGILREECSALLSGFFRNLRKKR